jgi:hypothetical protein
VLLYESLICLFLLSPTKFVLAPCPFPKLVNFLRQLTIAFVT